MRTRRAFLASVTGGAVVLAGCTAPRTDPTQPNTSEPTAAPTDSSTPDQPQPTPTETSPETPSQTETPAPESDYYVDELNWGEADCSTLHDVTIDADQLSTRLYLYVHSHLSLSEETTITGSELTKPDESTYRLDIQTEDDVIGEPCTHSVWYEAVVVLPEYENSTFTLEVAHNGVEVGGYGQHGVDDSHHEQ